METRAIIIGIVLIVLLGLVFYRMRRKQMEDKQIDNGFLGTINVKCAGCGKETTIEVRCKEKWSFVITTGLCEECSKKCNEEYLKTLEKNGVKKIKIYGR